MDRITTIHHSPIAPKPQASLHADRSWPVASDSAKPIFYLGTHQPHWLGRAAVPLFVSRNRLAHRRSFPRAVERWALDSGGFTQLAMHGGWTISPTQYADDARRYSQEIGRLDFAAPQDWMCEPWILKRTALSVNEHQKRTLTNFLELEDLAPDVPWIPVLQGWAVHDYWRHVEMYAEAGVDLVARPLVGVGTICRRQASATAGGILASLATAYRLRLHAFGFKTLGLRQFSGYIISADSMAWSLAARKARDPLPGCQHASCSNCLRFAMLWRDELPEEWL